jgi:hypothetical protein
VNVLLERLDALAQADVARQRQEPGGFSPHSGTSQGAGGGVAALAAGQDHLVRRLARVQELASELVGAVAHSQNGLSSTAQHASEALRTVGAAIAAADSLLSGTQRGAEFAGRLRRSAANLLPSSSDGQANGDFTSAAQVTDGPPQSIALRGLGHDLEIGEPDLASPPGANAAPAATSAVAARTAAESAGAQPGSAVVAPSDAYAEIASSDGGEIAAESLPTGKRRRGKPADLVAPGELDGPITELTQMLTQLDEEMARQEHDAGAVTHELAIVNRNARGVDVGVAWAVQALEAIRRNAERLHQAAGGNAMIAGPGGFGPLASQPADFPSRAPQATRPLSASGKLAPDILGSGALPTEDLAADNPAEIAQAASPAGEAGDSPTAGSDDPR